ncbi:MAG: hypothetical protein HYV96_19390 [Opitutae bacterium]|nr:hypothetical protein [Opitutae bacterium]
MEAIRLRTADEVGRGEWILSTRIADALAEAESRYGGRHGSFELSGYEYWNEEHPQIDIDHDARAATIYLVEKYRGNEPIEIHQAAHEVVHLLGPRHPARPTNFEEGLATLFAEQYAEAATGIVFLNPPPNFRAARDAVRDFAADDSIIRSMRLEEPIFADFTPALLLKFRPGFPVRKAEFLCESFKAL